VIPFAFLVPVVVAVVVLVAVREVHRRAPAGTGRGRVARVGSVVVAVIVVVVVARLVVAPLPSDRTLTWKPGVVFDAAQAEANVVRIEVERPACAPDGDGWIATPTVTDTPLAVFITVGMAETFDVPGCTGTLGYQGGLLPAVGGYLTGTYLDVHLAEALGGRLLFDGAGLLPEPRLPLR
jgi:hypothetical protein